MLGKPDRVFDRDIEWGHLAGFASPVVGRPRLGVVSGRRRQGKTYLVEALARESGGCYFGATQATEVESLRLFADAVGRCTNAPVPPRFLGWDEDTTSDPKPTTKADPQDPPPWPPLTATTQLHRAIMSGMPQQQVTPSPTARRQDSTRARSLRHP